MAVVLPPAWRVFLAYFLGACIVGNVLFFFTFKPPPPAEVFATPSPTPAVPAVSLPSLCTNIATLTANGSTITVTYAEPHGTNIPKLAASHFAMKTKWLNQSIFFPLSSGTAILLPNGSVALNFYLPVVDRYQATVYCASPTTALPPRLEDLKPHVINTFQVDLFLDDFVQSDAYSQFRCHNVDSFPRRWCEFRNLAFFDQHFFFYSPAVFRFPQPFIVPGPRAPPFDKEQDQFIIEPIVVQIKPSHPLRRLVAVTDFCYIYGVFHNYDQLWHTMFDFVIPLYHFIRMLNGRDTVKTRRICVRSDGVGAFHAMMEIFTLRPTLVVDTDNPSLLLTQGVVGIEKLERNMNASRTYDDSIGFNYDFNRSIAVGLREAIMNALWIPNNQGESPDRPLVLLIDGAVGARNLQNSNDILKILIGKCPHCDVQRVEFHNMQVEQQIKRTVPASVLVGLHGSDLTHTIWMAASRANHPTHLIEIVPYRYGCRNWYETAAIIAGVNYHRIMNKNRPPNVTDAALINCWNHPEKCATQGCHDKLRDQPVTVELDTFTSVWEKIADGLRATVATNPE